MLDCYGLTKHNGVGMNKNKQSKKYPVQLSKADLTQLETFVKTGKHRSQEIIRARILLLSYAKHTDKQIMDKLGCSNWLVPAMR